MTSKSSSFIQNIISTLQKIETAILSGLLISMILMAVLQIALRNLFDSGILWGDELVRVLVLWIGLMGAMVASRDNHHISIDVISRYLPIQVKNLTTVFIAAFTSFICAAMAYFSFGFVVMEKAGGFTAFAGVPAWICESIIPVSFTIISVRYLLLAFSFFAKLFRQIPQ